MKPILFFLAVCLSFQLVFAQEAKVIRYYPEKQLAIINQGQMYGIEKGAILSVYRDSSQEIAKVEVLKVVKKYAVIKILSSEKEIAVGDLVSSGIDFPLFPDNQPETSRDLGAGKSSPQLAPPKKSNTLAWGLIGVGIVSAGLSAYWHVEAEDNFSKYKSATTAESAVKYREEVKSLQSRRNTAAVVAGISTFGGIILLMMNKHKAVTGYQYSSLPTYKNICLTPHIQFNRVGFGITINF